MAGQTTEEYVASIVARDFTWQSDALCAGSPPAVVTMFTCTEDEAFEMNGRAFTGYDIQCYLVDSFCRHCPVQWECARFGLEEEAEMGDRTTGAWGMTRRDRRWLHKRDDALGQVDLAKANGEPVADMIVRLRSE